jgi:hypothetical protein
LFYNNTTTQNNNTTTTIKRTPKHVELFSWYFSTVFSDNIYPRWTLPHYFQIWSSEKEERGIDR